MLRGRDMMLNPKPGQIVVQLLTQEEARIVGINVPEVATLKPAVGVVLEVVPPSAAEPVLSPIEVGNNVLFSPEVGHSSLEIEGRVLLDATDVLAVISETARRKVVWGGELAFDWHELGSTLGSVERSALPGEPTTNSGGPRKKGGGGA
jgi:co-chaperonin GroES (HSP10)